MRILAKRNDQDVVIVELAYVGKENANLKAIYINEDGEIDEADASDFTVGAGDLGLSFVEAVKRLKPKAW